MAAITEQEARQLWKEADAVCFDVDSTVIKEEGCDELARFLGKAEEVAELELVQKLHSRGVKVFLVSGGFHCLIRPVAAALNIPAENITANKLLFDFFGNYAGFDESQPTSASGGKARALERLIDEHKLRCLAMVGDGATDLEAAPPAHVFIGYGGNVVRPKVQEAAPWFVHHFQELIDALSESD